MTGDSVSGLRFQVLGSLRGWRGDEELNLGSAHRRAVLAMLAVSVGNVVSRHELIDALWGENAPSSAEGSIYTYISGLRRVLEPERAPRSSGHVLASAGSGYSLQVDPDQVDLHRFDALRAAGTRQRKEGRPEAALESLEAALALWHGDALSGLPGPFAAAQRTKLSELRLSTLESRAEILLDLGRHNELIAELTALCQDHPLRERLRALLMRALHADGRTAEALEVFADARATLIDTSGIEPGPELRKLHQWLLTEGSGGDSDSESVLPIVTSPELTRPVPTVAEWRPPAPELFVGREDERKLLASAIADVLGGRGGVVWLEGEPGIGKTALLAETLARTDLGPARLRWVAAQEIDSGIPAQLIRDCLGLGAGDAEAGRALEVVERMAADGPVILVAEDLQWADDASLAIWHRLTQLTSTLPVLVISSARPVPRGQALQQLRQRVTTAGQTISLDSLGDSEVFELVEQLTGAPPPSGLRNRVDWAAGNPHYIHEIIDALAAEAPQPPNAAALPPPERLVTRINNHLTFLSAETRTMVQWATLLGETFTGDELATATGRRLTELTDNVDEAVAAGILVDDFDALRFRHRVVWAALRERTPSAMRSALHRQFAETLAAAGAPAVQVAEQLAATASTTDWWVHQWLSANIGTVATARPQLAVGLLRQVIASGSPERGDEFSPMLARLLFWLGRSPESEARSVIARTTDPVCAAEMRWILAYLHYTRDDTAAALSEVDQVLADPRVHGGWRERHELLRAVLTGELAADPAGTPMRFTELKLLDEDTRRTLGVGGSYGWPLATASWRLAPYRALPAGLHLTNAACHFWFGDWQSAQAELDSLTRDDHGYSSYLLQQSAVPLYSLSAMIAAFRDDPDLAQAQLCAAVTHATWDGQWRPGNDFLSEAKSEVAHLTGDSREAFDALVPLLDLPSLPISWSFWLPRLARLAVELGESSCAERIQNLTSPASGTFAPEQDDILRAYCRALAADDPDALVRIATVYRTTAGLNLMAVRALDDTAWMLSRHGRKDEARVALIKANAAYRKLGATQDVRRIRDAMASLGCSPAVLVSGADTDEWVG